jgi:hypothetical protein
MRTIHPRLKEKCWMELEKTPMQLLESIEDCLLTHRLLPRLILTLFHDRHCFLTGAG